MERIGLSKIEKQVLLHVKEHGEEQPRSVTPVMFLYCLSTLREKGLVEFRADYDEVIKARLTNPEDWKGIITLGLVAVIAVTIVALFAACR